MDKNPFLKRVMKPVKEDIFHSSAYGRAQSGGGMGSASTESFSDRMKIEQRRTMIKGYSGSSIANSAIGSGPRAKTFTPSASSGSGLGPKPMPPKNPGISR